MSLIKKIQFKDLGDKRGSLIALESMKDIPFGIKRVYFISDTKGGISRGFHAHKNLKQVVVCVKGSCKFIIDNGHMKEETILNSPNSGLLIEDMLWREMHDFSSDCILLVLASEYHDESDYIRNYQEFLNEVTGDN